MLSDTYDQYCAAAAEFNFFVDPDAASRVFRSGVDLTMIPLNCTHQALLTDARLEVLRRMGTPLGTAFYHLLEFNKRFDLAKYGWPGGPLHDATVTAYLLEPELFTGRKVFVDIFDLQPGSAAGLGGGSKLIRRRVCVCLGKALQGAGGWRDSSAFKPRTCA